MPQDSAFVDLNIPVYLGDLDESFSQTKVSAIAIQVKNERALNHSWTVLGGTPAAYAQLSPVPTIQMQFPHCEVDFFRSPRASSSNEFPLRSIKQPMMSIIMDMGVTDEAGLYLNKSWEENAGDMYVMHLPGMQHFRSNDEIGSVIERILERTRGNRQYEIMSRDMDGDLTMPLTGGD